MIGGTITILTMIANWMIAKKMGRKGWEGIVPIYNVYVFFEVLYGNGWKFLFLLIPFYNIYLGIKFAIDLAHAFHKSTGFGIGLILLSVVFILLLAFGDAQFGDGSQANTEEDFVTKAADKAKEMTAASPKTDPQALEKLEKLNELRAKGLISEEEFNAKKAELLKRV